MLTAIWIVVVGSLALWSALGWGLYRLLVTDHQWLGDLKPLIERIPFGEQIEAWVPGWQALLESVIDVLQWSLSALGAGAPVVVWVIWGAGTLLLVLGGALLSLLVLMLRDPPARGAPGTGARGD